MELEGVVGPVGLDPAVGPLVPVPRPLSVAPAVFEHGHEEPVVGVALVSEDHGFGEGCIGGGPVTRAEAGHGEGVPVSPLVFGELDGPLGQAHRLVEVEEGGIGAGAEQPGQIVACQGQAGLGFVGGLFLRAEPLDAFDRKGVGVSGLGKLIPAGQTKSVLECLLDLATPSLGGGFHVRGARGKPPTGIGADDELADGGRAVEDLEVGRPDRHPDVDEEERK